MIKPTPPQLRVLRLMRELDKPISLSYPHGEFVCTIAFNSQHKVATNTFEGLIKRKLIATTNRKPVYYYYLTDAAKEILDKEETQA